MDRLSSEYRSWNMSRIRGRDTKPELRVRQMLHGSGYRYQLHRRDLPGTPDIVFSKRRKAIFVHGCFWHRHPGCRYAYEPKSRAEFWKSKFESNIRRDEEALTKLKEIGWESMIVWECELKDAQGLKSRLVKFVGPTSMSGRSRAWRKHSQSIP